MVAKRKDNEWTTIRIRWETKEVLVKLGIGRETDDEILQRVLKRFNVKVTKKEEEAPYLGKLNSHNKSRKKR